MAQLIQELKSGKMQILEVPIPALSKGKLLVRNHFSVISAGTEGRSVSDARKGYIAKAKSRQKEVKQVIAMIKSDGLMDTYKLVMNKLEAPSGLGYSCSGEVLAVGEGVRQFKVGDFVACGGQGAEHADVVSVFENLCVKVPETVDLKQAAFATVASIAIQGIRQGELNFGENCVVIGLGLLGQITLQILEATGIRCIGIDINDQQVEFAKKNGARLALNRNQSNIEQIIYDYTEGECADAVLITAASNSTDPVDLAGALCRKKGKVVIVGRVPTNFDRTHYYKKELDLRMSTSYGPGRYDANYEEKGIDYPIGYVRWTENRNMKSFVNLLAEKKIDLSNIITHEYGLEDAPAAYNMIIAKSEHFAGILIRYDGERAFKDKVILKAETYASESVNVGLIGAGSFGQNSLLPRLNGMCNFVGVATNRGTSGRYVADKYKFNYCTTNSDEIFEDTDINTIFIVTRHNLHAQFVKKALLAQKNVFVEKPLAVNIEELEEIRSVYQDSKYSGRLMVGFNRRFSPHVLNIKERFMDESPKSILCRVNAKKIPPDHWGHDPEIGGGRIVGEVCHFIDLSMFIAGAHIAGVAANELRDANGLMDTVTINLSFENGSVATISYFSNGNEKVPKEYIEVYCNGETAIIDDFKSMTFYGKKISKMKLKKQDKGHYEELKRFVHSIQNGEASPIGFPEIYNASLATIKTIESIRQNRLIQL